MERVLLLVDDEPRMLDALYRVFRSQDYQIFMASGAQEALAILEHNPKAVVLSDHRMPQMTGTELLAKVRQDFPDTVRIVLSGYADFDTVMQAINSGAVYKFLEKPFQDDQLREVIAEAFELLEEQVRLRGWGTMIASSEEALLRLDHSFRVILSTPEAESVFGGLDDGDGRPLKLDGQSLLKWCPELQVQLKHTDVEAGSLLSLQLQSEEGGKGREKEMQARVYPLPDGWQICLVAGSHCNGLPDASALDKERFISFLDREIALGIGTHACLFALEIHNFHRIRDCFDEANVDRLLQVVAEKLSARLNPEDRLGWLGGDSFVLYRHQLQHSESIDQEILELLQPFDSLVSWDHEACYLRFYSSYVRVLEDGNSSGELLQNARLALQTARLSERDHCPRYNAGMTRLNRTGLELQKGLCRALARDELEVLYQCKVDLKRQEIEGAEALLRWRHDTLGMISPSEFIPEAEDSGLINPIGEWVLQMAIAQACIWRQQGLPAIKLGVNLSAVQLNRAGIVAEIGQLLEAVELPARSLELEITETALPKDLGQCRARLLQLKNKGCSLAIDDFGTGYASFNYLRELPVDVLKIDRVFVTGIEQSQERYRLICNMISMGHDLGLRVVAEGVENRKQLELLLLAGCDSAQGFLFSPPVTGAEFGRQLSGKFGAKEWLKDDKGCSLMEGTDEGIICR